MSTDNPTWWRGKREAFLAKAETQLTKEHFIQARQAILTSLKELMAFEQTMPVAHIKMLRTASEAQVQPIAGGGAETLVMAGIGGSLIAKKAWEIAANFSEKLSPEVRIAIYVLIILALAACAAGPNVAGNPDAYPAATQVMAATTTMTEKSTSVPAATLTTRPTETTPPTETPAPTEVPMPEGGAAFIEAGFDKQEFDGKSLYVLIDSDAFKFYEGSETKTVKKLQIYDTVEVRYMYQGVWVSGQVIASSSNTELDQTIIFNTGSPVFGGVSMLWIKAIAADANEMYLPLPGTNSWIIQLQIGPNKHDYVDKHFANFWPTNSFDGNPSNLVSLPGFSDKFIPASSGSLSDVTPATYPQK